MVDDFFGTSPRAIGINVTSDGASGSYYNMIVQPFVRRCTIGIHFGYNSNANTIQGGIVTNVRNDIQSCGVLIENADTNTIIDTDIEGHDSVNSSGAINIIASTRHSSYNKFFGVRMEGNYINVNISAGVGASTGAAKFYGCSASNTGGTNVIDNGDWDSYFHDFTWYNITNLRSVLRLTPRAVPPTLTIDGMAPSEGMIYADTDHHLYYYNGTSWLQLDN